MAQNQQEVQKQVIIEQNKANFQQYKELPDSKFSIVFFGRTGAGKSSILNNLQREKNFEEGDTLQSCTRQVEWHIAPFHADKSGQKVLFIDTPGFNDSNASIQQTLLHKMINFIKLIRKGFNFFFFMIPLTQNRIDSSMQASLKILGSLFGNEVYQKTRIVFSHFNQFKPAMAENRIKMFFDQLPLKLRTLDINIPTQYFVFDYDNREDGGLSQLINCVKKSQKFCPQILDEVEKFIDCDFSDPMQLINELMSSSKQFNKAINEIHNLNDLVEDLNKQNIALDQTVKQLRTNMKTQDQRNKALTDRIQKMRKQNMENQAKKDERYMQQFLQLNNKHNQQLMSFQQQSMKQQAQASRSTNEAILNLQRINSQQMMSMSQLQQQQMRQQTSQTMVMMQKFVQKSENSNKIIMESCTAQLQQMSQKVGQLASRKPIIQTRIVQRDPDCICKIF